MEEVVEVAAVATVATAATYVGVKTVETVSDAVSSSSGSSSSPSYGSSSSRGCCGSPTYSGKVQTIYDWWGNGLSYQEYEKLKDWGYDVWNGCFPLEEVKTIIRCEEKIGQPPVNEPGWEEKYEPPKDWDGKKKRVNDKSPKKGYPDKKGRVWVPNDKQHGGAGWKFKLMEEKTIFMFARMALLEDTLNER